MHCTNLISLEPIVLLMTNIWSASTMIVSGSTWPETTVSPRPQLAVIVTLPSSPNLWRKYYFLKIFTHIQSLLPVTGSAVKITPANADVTISWMTTHISVMIGWPFCLLQMNSNYDYNFYIKIKNIILLNESFTCTQLI